MSRDPNEQRQPGVVDRSAYNYGGDPNAADRESGALAATADYAQRRQGEQINTQNPDQDRGAANDSRGAQTRMADMLYRRASGQTPSIAGMVGDRQMGQVAAEQTSIAAGARGPAALALAQQGSAANTANTQSNISNQVQINSANERAEAERGALAGYSNIRQGDQAQQGQDFAQSKDQSLLNAAQRAQNDQYTMGTRAQGIGIQGMQLGADMNRDAAEQAGHFNAAGLQQQKNAAHDSSVMGWVNAGLQSAATVGSLAAGSDERMKDTLPWGASAGGISAGTNAGYGSNAQSPLDMHTMLAHRALEAQVDQDVAARLGQQTRGVGPQAYDGVEALRRRDSEDLGLIKAQERNGAKLSEEQDRSRAALQYRVGKDERGAARALESKEPDAAAKALTSAADDKAKLAAEAKAKATGDAIQGGASRIGSALVAGAAPQAQWHPTGPAVYATPQLSSMSDAETKVPADSGGGEPSGGSGNAKLMAGAKGIGAALMAGAKPAEEFHPTSPTHYDTPQLSTSDDRTKLAAAWDEGHKAALGDVQKMRMMSPADLRAAGEGGNGMANALRGAKADAYDEGQGRSSTMVPTIPEHLRQPEPQAREPEPRRSASTGNYSRQDKGPAPTMAGAAFDAVHGAMSEGLGRVYGLADRKEDPLKGAARAMEAQPYAYKPQFAAAEGQAPGEKNIGPMAQNLAEDAAAATAVKRDPSTGLLKLDIAKLVKLNSGVSASLQKQADDHDERIARHDEQLASMTQMLGGRR